MTKRSSVNTHASHECHMGDVEQIRGCASGLYALAFKARDNNFNDYAG